MRLFNFSLGEHEGIGIDAGNDTLRGMREGDEGYPGSLDRLLAAGPEAMAAAGSRLAGAPVLDPSAIAFLPPVIRPAKVLCIGLNYADHGQEVGINSAGYPTVFCRFASGFVGHRAAMLRPRVSTQFDYEGELAVIIGKKARRVAVDSALDHVVGYSIFNDGSLRDYQLRSTQWTMGKNFDHTAGFGPFLVTADEVPPGGAGLRLRTRLNGETVQDASTDTFLFDVPTLIALLSEVMTLEPGDVIATGTPSGVGAARKPQLFMKHGDVCEVEIDGLGILRNPILDEPR